MRNFEPYMRMMLYAILDAVRLSQKGDKDANEWLEGEGLITAIKMCGLEGKLKPETVLGLRKCGRVKKRLECLVLGKEFSPDKEGNETYE